MTTGKAVRWVLLALGLVLIVGCSLYQFYHLFDDWFTGPVWSTPKLLASLVFCLGWLLLALAGFAVRSARYFVVYLVYWGMGLLASILSFATDSIEGVMLVFVLPLAGLEQPGFPGWQWMFIGAQSVMLVLGGALLGVMLARRGAVKKRMPGE